MDHQRVTIHVLPDNVMVEIFSYLSLQQLKQASLTCIPWYHLAHQHPIQKNYFSVVHGELAPKRFCLSPRTSLGSFLRLRYPSPNMAFVYCTISFKLQRDLWMSHGKRITFLAFGCCKIRSRDLANILHCCPNLQELEFYKCDLSKVQPILRATDVKLRRLRIDGDCKWFVADDFLDSISAITTRLETFEFWKMSPRPDDESNRKRPTFYAFLRFLQKCASTLSELDLRDSFFDDTELDIIFAIESLKLKCVRLSCVSNENDVILNLSRSQGVTLQELEIRLVIVSLSDAQVFQSLLLLRELKMLKLAVLLPKALWKPPITDLLVKGLPKLHQLDFLCFFQKSKPIIEFCYDLSLSNQLSDTPSKSLLKFFGQSASAITVLKLFRVRVSNSSMRRIYCNMPHLVTVSLGLLCITDEGLTSCHCSISDSIPCQTEYSTASIRDLVRLNNLQLNGLWNITDFGIGAIRFSNLTVLELEYLPKVTSNVFSVIGIQNPCLEVLTLRDIGGLNHNSLVVLLKTCPNLTTLNLEGPCNHIQIPDLSSVIKEFGKSIRSLSVGSPLKPRTYRFF